ncbi:EAL domain-containing protein [Wenzhouxiangella sp. XN79A]|uniref:EAL domain-containing protein n=1 Tax=Wenzhouxiangella sp. XN79A TaxID=2724193 RepID=UPI00144AE690|nr:EAL domain-containing protein [Wenzhouxiangella sp. XN79A]NKI33865.1 EAL domain-containing protein [Wenzhouxiangella sp. XN79A]
MDQNTDVDRSAAPLSNPERAAADFSFAFQPIVDLETAEVVAHEALVRGASGESAGDVLGSIRPESRHLFDEACRHRALDIAARLGMQGALHINCSTVTPERLEATLASTREAAEDVGIDPGRVVLEFSRLEPLGSPRELDRVRQVANQAGFEVLADNFGASEVGMKRLVVFQPQWLKLDRNLVQRIHCSERRKALVSGLLATCRLLNIDVIAGGIEEPEELEWMKSAGVRYAQGYLLARPTFESVPRFDPARLAV